jgi:phospholipid/cholesterol/gamma-HCH transport system permease protein
VTSSTSASGLEPSLSVTGAGSARTLVASGSWTVAHLQIIGDLTRALNSQTSAMPPVAIDVRGVTELDTYGAVALRDFSATARADGRPAQLIELPSEFRDLYQQVSRCGVTPAPPSLREGWLTHQLSALGHGTVSLTHDLAALAHMLGAIVTAFFRTLLRPTSFRLTSTVHQLDRVAWQAVPIILLITFLIGGIIAQQGIFHFRKFGADVYVVDMVGILVLREIGVLIVAIMVAGRSGSSYTAELGSMKMREEIDALQTMGLDPVEVLILPRVLALIVGLPILAFLGSMAALYGAELICWFYGGMGPDIFLARLKEAISLTHFQVGIIKAPFMALVIGVVACAEGLQVKGSAQSLGLKTTASVVKSIFLVIILDGLFAIFFASIDM